VIAKIAGNRCPSNCRNAQGAGFATSLNDDDNRAGTLSHWTKRRVQATYQSTDCDIPRCTVCCAQRAIAIDMFCVCDHERPTNMRRTRDSTQTHEPQYKQHNDDQTYNPYDLIHDSSPLVAKYHSLYHRMDRDSVR